MSGSSDHPSETAALSCALTKLLRTRMTAPEWEERSRVPTRPHSPDRELASVCRAGGDRATDVTSPIRRPTPPTLDRNPLGNPRPARGSGTECRIQPQLPRAQGFAREEVTTSWLVPTGASGLAARLGRCRAG